MASLIFFPYPNEGGIVLGGKFKSRHTKKYQGLESTEVINEFLHRSRTM